MNNNIHTINSYYTYSHMRSNTQTNTGDPHNPLVSVIMPAFNTKPYLDEAISSVINQTYRNLELIIIDDGSNDGTRELCDYWAEKDARIVVIHQPNEGVAYARNRGLDSIGGDIIGFLDSDDAISSDMIEKMLNSLLRYNADIAVCGFSKYYTKSSLDSPRGGFSFEEELILEKDEALRAAVDGKINVAVFNKLFKRNIWDGIRFPPIPYAEDRAVILRTIDRAKKICLIPDMLYKHRIHSKSLVHVFNINHMQAYLAAEADFQHFVENRIPDVFTEEQFRILRQKSLTIAISKYAMLPLNNLKLENPDDQVCRDAIIRMGNDIDINKCRTDARIAWIMLNSCPNILKCLQRIYHKYRVLINKTK